MSPSDSDSGRKYTAALMALRETCDARQLLQPEMLGDKENGDKMRFIKIWMQICLCDGQAQYTGNNRTYSNGAVAYEVRCRKCQRPFWITTTPYALCPDCA
jgi:hypothetical protein